MKLNISSPFILFLLPAISTALADGKPNAQPTVRASYGSSGLDARYADTDSYASGNVAKGSSDVPVDGKDGKPHAGPWVETGAERDRKITGNTIVGSDDYELAPSRLDTKIPSSDHLNTDGGKVIPHSNGGVMNDPNRAGPKEGTRGTEGGVSAKEKENQYAEKVPGSPKEAPPLPHGEKQKFSSDSDSASGSGGRTADEAGTLGMLEVRHVCLLHYPAHN